jgi:transketolase
MTPTVGTLGALVAPNAQADILARPHTQERRMADAIRALAIDAAEAARTGHPVMPLGMADAATVLWTRFHKFDAADPRWPDRDRFILSAGHGSMLLYALLHLTGHAGMDIGEIKRFGQPDSAAPGRPEFGSHPGIEATAGPLGQGLAAAVGMALAERMLAARFGRSLVDHRTWVVACDGDLAEGISHEAASLAGQLRLEKLTVIWDNNAARPDADVSAGGIDDPLRRFASYGWATKRVDGHDAAAVAGALSMALRSKKPTLIAAQTVIGGALRRTNGVTAGSAAHDEVQSTKLALGWDHPPFELPDSIAAQWHRARLAEAARPPSAAGGIRACHRRPAPGSISRGICRSPRRSRRPAPEDRHD